MMLGEEWRGCCKTTSAQYHDAECLSEANQKRQQRMKLATDLVQRAHELDLLSTKRDGWDDDRIQVSVEDFEKLIKAYEE